MEPDEKMKLALLALLNSMIRLNESISECNKAIGAFIEAWDDADGPGLVD